MVKQRWQPPCGALRQMGRIERTLFTLDWIHDEQLRKTTTAELNKGKSRNSLVPAGRTL
jgi:TnpA family transposase